jgi:hypothetical protein
MGTSTHILWLGALTRLHDVMYMWINKILHCVNYVHAAVILSNVYSVKGEIKKYFFLSYLELSW